MNSIDEYELRPIASDEYERWVAAAETSFGEHVRPEDLEGWRSLTDLDRTVGAFDAGRIVATSLIDTLELTVPGGAAVPMAGVTAVGVLPTHRRRGLLGAMMRRMLEQAVERAEPVAGLWASESVIYQRFGFGWAASGASYTLARPHTAFRAELPASSAVRILDDGETLDLLPPIYERARPLVPGMLNRSEPRWHEHFGRDPEHRRDGASGRFIAVYEDQGYVSYRIKRDWRDGSPNAKLTVEEMVAVAPDALARLWRWTLDIDLVVEVHAFNRPADDPLPLLLADPRRLRVQPWDTLWIRILDVPAALSARAYAADGAVVLEVSDDFGGWAAGTFRLDAAGGSGACEAAPEASPDISLGAAELAAAYLGGERLTRLARAGRVIERSPGALAAADRMFASDPLPWCPWVF